MNFQLIKALSVAVISFSFLFHETVQVDPIKCTRNGTKANSKIMKAFLMQCPENISSRNNNNNNRIRVTIQIAVHGATNKAVNLSPLL